MGYFLQTLLFVQKEDCGLTPELQLKHNRDELERYKLNMERNRVRYQIVEAVEQPDASILVRVKKQLNDKTDVSEYFN